MKQLVIAVATLLMYTQSIVAQKIVKFNGQDIVLKGAPADEYKLYNADKTVFMVTKNYVQLRGNICTWTTVAYSDAYATEVTGVEVYEFDKMELKENYGISKTTFKEKNGPDVDSYRIIIQSKTGAIKQTSYTLMSDTPRVRELNTMEMLIDDEFSASLIEGKLK